MVASAIEKHDAVDFENFFQDNPHLGDKNLLFKYYTKEVLFGNLQARSGWVYPDIQQLIIPAGIDPAVFENASS